MFHWKLKWEWEKIGWKRIKKLNVRFIKKLLILNNMKIILKCILLLNIFTTCFAQNVEKKYVKIKRETFLKTDHNSDVGELYITNSDYPFEILESYYDKYETSFKIKINDEEFWVSNSWSEKISNEEALEMLKKWNLKIAKENEIKENEIKDEKDRIVNEEREKIEKVEKKKKEKKERLAYLKKKFGKDAEKILNGNCWIGMSKSALLESLGNPETINKSVSKWGINEQFVYSYSVYVYLENGVVTSYQTTE